MSNDHDGHGLGPDEILLEPMRATRRPFYYVALLLFGLASVAFIAAISVIVGMWLVRLAIVVPTMVSPRVPVDDAAYWPTWVELGISVGSLSCFAFLYLLFTKFFPIISIWEGREHALVEVTRRMRSYMPPQANAER